MNLPQEFTQKMQKLLGDSADDFFKSLDSPSQKGITCNFDRMDKAEFEKHFDNSISPIPRVSNGYFVDSFKFNENLFNHMGVIYSQEPSAMYPVEMLDVEPGDIVLDMCASPGGKSIQILEKLHGTGVLVSNEIVFNRAKILDENISKMGFENSIITCNTPEDFENCNLHFDKILIDAPCGGEGMIRKSNFDLSFYNPNAIGSNAKRQLSILQSAKNLLKDGGVMVYSTCTYDILENEDVIAKFLEENENFEILQRKEFESVADCGFKIGDFCTNYSFRRYPHKFKGEGQFMVTLKKCGTGEPVTFKKSSAKNYTAISAKEKDIISATLSNITTQKFEFLKRGEYIYVIPATHIDMQNLNVITFGCLLGSIQKGILKIAPEFYHTFGKYFINKIEITKEDAMKYIHGEEIDCNYPNGIYAVNYLGVTLGGGKVCNERLKNYYKKNCRI